MQNFMKLNNLEIARTVGDHRLDEKYLRIRIPRLMAKINNASIEHFDNNIFVNDDNCRVYPQNNLTIQNYITVPKSTNCDLSHVAVMINGIPIIPNNTSVVCSCIYDTSKITVIDSY